MEINSIRSLTTMAGVIFCPIRRLLLKKVACVSVCVYRSTHTFRSGDSSGCHSSGADPLFCQAATFISLALAKQVSLAGPCQACQPANTGESSCLHPSSTDYKHVTSCLSFLFFLLFWYGFWGSNSGSHDCSFTNWTIFPAVVKNDFNI